MTLLFVPACDSPTKANLAVAHKVRRSSDVDLFGHLATQAELRSAILGNQQNRSLLLMSHGSKDAVWDNNKAPAVTIAEHGILEAYTVFAWACHTGSRLGYELAQRGVTWWGYDCAVTAPESQEPFLDIHSKIFREITDRFQSGIDETTVHIVLERIKVTCEMACELLDSVMADTHTDAFSLYSCCNQIWQRLSVWLAGHGEPCRHPMAPPAYIDL